MLTTLLIRLAEAAGKELLARQPALSIGGAGVETKSSASDPVTEADRVIRRGGSAALDLCSVADGTANAYYEHVIQPWDIAAGALIAREAGAEVLALSDGVLAAPPVLAAALAELLTPRRLV